MAIAAVIMLVLVAMVGMPLAYGDVSYSCNNGSIVATKPALIDVTGNPRPVAEGVRIVISTTVSESCGMDHPAIVILEVRDSNDMTVFLGLQNFTIQADSQVQVAVSWMPRQAGEFQLRAFTLVSFDSLGSPKVATSKIDVAESGMAFVVIPYDPDPSLQQSNFEPDSIKVILGINNTVSWINDDVVTHRLEGERTFVSSKPVDFEEPFFISLGYSSSHTFTESGLYEYHDRNRPWMRGFVYVLPSDAADAHLDLEISGLEDAYKLGDKVELAVDIKGYETGCGAFEAKVEKVDGSGEPFSFSSGAFFDCDVNPPFGEVSYHFPEEAPPIDVPITQPGTYRVTASFEGTIVSASTVREFEIS